MEGFSVIIVFFRLRARRSSWSFRYRVLFRVWRSLWVVFVSGRESELAFIIGEFLLEIYSLLVSIVVCFL